MCRGAWKERQEMQSKAGKGSGGGERKHRNGSRNRMESGREIMMDTVVSDLPNGRT